AILQRHCDHALEVGVVEWFVDIGDGTKFKSGAGAFGVGIPGYHNHRDSRIERADSLEYLKPAQIGKRDIEQDKMRIEGSNEPQAFLARQRTLDRVALLA